MSTLQLFKKDFYERIGGLKIFKDLTVLDLGCGDGEDADNISKFAKKVIGVDMYKFSTWNKIKGKKVRFSVSKAEKLPFKKQEFSGLFLKDVLHHVENIDKTMKEIKRVTKKDAVIVLIEGNRYNPLFYIHMTKLKGHEHLTQGQFKKIILKYFPNAQFNHFECHYMPYVGRRFFRVLIIIEKFISIIPGIQKILSYNMAIIQ